MFGRTSRGLPYFIANDTLLPMIANALVCGRTALHLIWYTFGGVVRDGTGFMWGYDL